MRRSEHAWRGSEVPYFGAAVAHRDTPKIFLPFADREAVWAERVMAVLLGIGSILAGFAVVGALFVMSFVFGFMSSPDRTEIAAAIALGAAIAVVGLAFAVAAWRAAGVPMGLTVDHAGLEIAYRSFSRPMIVPRSAVRVVAIEDGRTRLRDRERFPVSGDLPDDVFVDALDNPSAGPLDDLDTARRSRLDPWPGVIWEKPNAPSHGPSYSHDDPGAPGWASGGARGPLLRSQPEGASLFNRSGSSLPFLRGDVLDVPNVALIFDEPLRMPKSAWWFDLLPSPSRVAAFYPRGRTTRGVLMHVRDPNPARAALVPWGVVREITADDVTEQGLLLAKPLTGRRAAVYSLLVAGPIVLSLIIRWLR